MLKLTAEHSDILLSQPESGMGFQEVEATTTDNKYKKCIVYNAELLVYVSELEEFKKHASYYSRLLESSKDSQYEIKSLRVMADQSQIRYSKLNEGAESQVEVFLTENDEEFRRFSAYENDNRITSNFALIPGTFATTREDANNIRTGVEAVERYSLPNNVPAKYVFKIRPKIDTEIKKGVVSPAFGHKGGGDEVIFIKGTHNNTVLGCFVIPER